MLLDRYLIAEITLGGYMEKIISSPDIKITDPIKEQVYTSLNKLEHFNGKIIKAEVSLLKDNSENSKFIVKMDIQVAGQSHLYAESHHDDMYEGIQNTTNKLVTQLRKIKTKEKNMRHKTVA